MAEETQAEQPVKSAKKAPRRQRAGKAKAGAKAGTKAGAAAPKRLEALPTERPVPSAPEKKTSEYVVTVDNQTGMPVKIEKLDEGTGRREELTAEEYGQAMAYASLSYAPFYGNQVPTSAAEADTLMQAYYQGVADYLNALTSNR